MKNYREFKIKYDYYKGEDVLVIQNDELIYFNDDKVIVSVESSYSFVETTETFNDLCDLIRFIDESVEELIEYEKYNKLTLDEWQDLDICNKFDAYSQLEDVVEFLKKLEIDITFKVEYSLNKQVEALKKEISELKDCKFYGITTKDHLKQGIGASAYEIPTMNFEEIILNYCVIDIYKNDEFLGNIENI